MSGLGARGVRLAALAWLVLAALGGCGGSSKSSGSGRDDDRAGTNNSGSSGSAGTSVGMGGSNQNGGNGAVPPATSYCNGQPCEAPLACCMSTGECFDPNEDPVQCIPPPPDGNSQGRLACASNAHCAPGEFCSHDGELCIGPGHCYSMSACGFCGDVNPSAPPLPECRLCGCDGNTYPNVQTACRLGVNVVPGSIGSGCGERNMEGGAGSSTIGPREFVVCGHDGQCPSGNFCCAMVGRCHPESDRDICVPGPEGTRIACRTTENCGDREYCTGPGCDAPGGCVYYGSEGDCGVTFEPVCGCDGTTYTSAQCATSRGVRVDHSGECSGGE